jgi:hypothetical protein
MWKVGDKVAWMEMHKGRVAGTVVNDYVCRVTNSVEVKPDGNPRKGWKKITDLEKA